MNRFWLFRTNLTSLESYHQYNNLDDFEKNCWDFYAVIGLWILQNTDCREITVWRLTKKKNFATKFKLPNNKLFIQRFVKNFDECFKYPFPDATLFRGGFKEYCELTKKNPKFFGTKLYLGASKRKYPIYGGKYDKVLVEDERDLKKKNYIPFYKIGVPNIFKSLNLEKKWDICFPANFTQISYKGQEYFIKQISKSDLLKSLKIVNCGNKPEVGKKLCKKYGINNIEFLGHVDRFGVNSVLNHSKFGLVASNNTDGCPRVATEILGAGTPLLVRKETRLLDYYKNLDCVEVFDDNKLEKVYKKAKKNYKEMKQKNIEYLKHELNIDNIMKMNLKLWRN